MTEYVDKGAIISACGKYRYRLWREWRSHPAPAQWEMWTEEDGSPCLDGAGQQIGEPKSCVFIMLNPSTADGDVDDRTIGRCVGFAKSLGYDRLDVLNLFAFRATKPAELLALGHDDEPWGVENEDHFAELFMQPTGLVICGWGAHGGHLGQDRTVMGWLDRHNFKNVPVVALGLTQEGFPRHPLYLPASATPIPFDGT